MNIRKKERLKEELNKKYLEGEDLLKKIQIDLNNFKEAYEEACKYNSAKIKLNHSYGEDYYKLEEFIEKYENNNEVDINLKRAKTQEFISCYYSWFFPILEILKLIYPIGYEIFVSSYYQVKGSSLTERNYKLENYILKQFLINTTKLSYSNELKRIQIAFNLFNQQISVIKAVLVNLDSQSLNYENEVYLNFQEENIDSAQVLFDNDFIRAAGAICGVIIEKHLKKILLPFDDKAYSYNLSILNVECKRNSLYSETEKKRIDLYINYRNLCDHKNPHDPTKTQVQDLIDGTNWVLFNI